jgi:hypothetical protein
MMPLAIRITRAPGRARGPERGCFGLFRRGVYRAKTTLVNHPEKHFFNAHVGAVHSRAFGRPEPKSWLAIRYRFAAANTDDWRFGIAGCLASRSDRVMIKLEVTVDQAAFTREAEAHVAEDIMPVLVDALNEVGRAAVVGIVGAIDTNLDRPSPYTRSAPAMLPARLGGKRDPAALVFLRDDQAEYLDLIVNTGTRRAGARATTKLGPLLPGRDAPRDAFGNLPRGYVARVLREPNVAWVTLKPGAPPALVRRGRDGRTEVLAVIVRETHYKAVRLPFYDLVEQAVQREWPRAALRALSGATQPE